MPFSSVLGASSVIKPGVCTSATRPSVPYGGQLIYETDSNRLLVWDGLAWKTLAYSGYTSGSVLQVVSTTKTDTQTLTTATYTDITGLSVSITPTSTSSKVFITSNITAYAQTGNTQGFIRLVRGSTAIAVGDAAGSRVQATAPVSFTNAYQSLSTGLSFMDSPSTTSSTTYKLQLRDEVGYSVWINRSQNDTDSYAGGRFISTITAMEIAG
jgi:hypothetical protein